jgi:hypothetical protein
MRRVLILSVVVMAMAAGGCTGTVKVEPTDLSSVNTRAERKTVEQAVGKPEKLYELRGITYASYRYNTGGTRHYDLGPRDPSEFFLYVIASPILPIIIPVMHAAVRPMERLVLWGEQRAWLCVTYGEDQIAADVKTAVPSPCEPPGGIWGDEGGDAIARSQLTPIVDPALKARIIAYLDNNMRKFEIAMREYDAKNPDSLSPREGRTTGNTVFSYEVREANEERIVLRVVFGNGGRTQTKQLLVLWVDGDLEVVAHRRDAQGKEASSS